MWLATATPHAAGGRELVWCNFFLLLTLWEPTWVTVVAVMIDLLCSTYLVCRSWMKYYGVMPHLNYCTTFPLVLIFLVVQKGKKIIII